MAYCRPLEHELIMHLKNHFPPPAFQKLIVMCQDHGIYHNVRRTALEETINLSELRKERSSLSS